MRTTKPISTISFNTAPYLRLKLNELQKAKRISFWAFIPHKAEDDEGGKKDHIHLYLMPSKMLQTDDLRDELREPDFLHPDKPPLGVLPFSSSIFDDWYLYVLHDRGYLASKNQSRRFHYKHDDFITSDSDYLLFLARQIDMTEISPYASMLEAQEHGFNFEEFFRSHTGSIPLQQISAWRTAWRLLLESKTSRGSGKSHLVATEDGKYLLPSTGEIFDSIKDYERSMDEQNQNGTT